MIGNPQAAHTLGLGMVYQHFTLVPAMTVAENLVLARDNVPGVVDWKKEKAEIGAFFARMPFKLPLDARVSSISAGERQKCEILKQLYLNRRFLILDEPTSVLTPGEADEVLGLLRDMVKAGDLTILMITHKFREVMAFADEVTILRRGKLAGGGKVADLTPDAMARMMIGAEQLTVRPARSGTPGKPRLAIEKLSALDDAGQVAVVPLVLGVLDEQQVGQDVLDLLDLGGGAAAPWSRPASGFGVSLSHSSRVGSRIVWIRPRRDESAIALRCASASAVVISATGPSRRPRASWTWCSAPAGPGSSCTRRWATGWKAISTARRPRPSRA